MIPHSADELGRASLMRVFDTTQLRLYGTTTSFIVEKCRLLNVTTTAPTESADAATIASASPVPWAGR